MLMMKYDKAWNMALVFLATVLALSACTRKSERAATDQTEAPMTPAITSPSPETHPALLDPALARETAPPTFKVRFETTKGDFVVEVTRAWAPNGADRLYNLARIGYFDGVTFFRVISGFMAQFGIHGEPKVSAAWRSARIPDDPVKQSNRRGFVSFATAGPNTRTTQLFINFVDNTPLDGSGFAPVGRVVEGMSVVDSLYSGYGEGAPRGVGPDQNRAQLEGNAYFRRDFPRLDYIKKATLVQ
jgi:peptidyl-prolyl cis-trans isomerase A (cyclophilin A)